MRHLIALLACVLCLAVSATADERITDYDVHVRVNNDGSVDVTEEISVNVENISIRHGIFRDLPRFTSEFGVKRKTSYFVDDVTLNGQTEPYTLMNVGDARRIRIGSASRMVPTGPQTYALSYRVDNQVRFHKDSDEIYWNATGSYWDFPIEQATVTVTLPPGADMLDEAAFTGRRGSTAQDYVYRQVGSAHVFETTETLSPQEGLTFALKFDKGVVAEPSFLERLWHILKTMTPVFIFYSSICGIWYYLHHWFKKVGVDPPKMPVVVQYGPPEDISAGAASFIYSNTIASTPVTMAGLLQMSIGKHMRMDFEKKGKTTILRRLTHDNQTRLAKPEQTFKDSLFQSGDRMELDGKYNADFKSAESKYHSQLKARYGGYFKWNTIYWIGGLGLSIVLTLLSVIWLKIQPFWLLWGVLILLVLNGLYLYLMPAPSKKGYRIRNHLLGFKQYLETAEKQYINAAKVGEGTPPVMSTQLYERFLPYAVAMGVEKPWTSYFQKVLPKEADTYKSSWTNSNLDALGGTTRALSSATGAVAAAHVSPSSSSSGGSGFGGGGFSGGGGGGGGGGGW